MSSEALSTFESPLLHLILLGGGGLAPAWGPLTDKHGKVWAWHPDKMWPLHSSQVVYAGGPLSSPKLWSIPLDAESPWPARLAAAAAWMASLSPAIAAHVSTRADYIHLEAIGLSSTGWLTKTYGIAWNTTSGAELGAPWGKPALTTLFSHLLEKAPVVALNLALFDIPEVRARVEAAVWQEPRGVKAESNTQKE